MAEFSLGSALSNYIPFELSKAGLLSVVNWIIIGLVLAIFFWLAMRLLKWNHKVLIIDKRGIARPDSGKKEKKDGTLRLAVLKAKANLSWPRTTIALNRRRNFIPLIEDNSGQLHNVRIAWDAQAISTEGDFVDLDKVYLNVNKVNGALETDNYGHASLSELPLVTNTGKEVILKRFPLMQPANTNVMREFIQNNKETIQTYHLPNKWERLAPYGVFALVAILSVVYWFAVAKWH